MNEKDFNKEMTVNELAVLMMNGFDRLRNDMDAVTVEMRQGFVRVDERFDRLERGHGARIEIVEERTVVLKKTVEKELDIKVAW